MISVSIRLRGTEVTIKSRTESDPREIKTSYVHLLPVSRISQKGNGAAKRHRGIYL